MRENTFMQYVVRFWRSALLLAGFVFASTGSAFAQEVRKFNMFYGVTPMSRDIYDLHMTILLICCIIGLGVFAILIYALINHRKSLGVKPAQFHEHQTVEIVWAIVPLVILVIMAIPATMVLTRMENADDSAVTIKITGYQWKWQYDYLDQGISFFSNLSTPLAQINNKEPKGKHYLREVDNQLVVPINEKIRFLITSNDVNHSWWVPALGVKKDAIPGFIHEAWAKIDKPGIYRGQCAELCGVNHGYMPIVVKAVTQEQFVQWVAKQKQKEGKATARSTQSSTQKTYTPDELMALGKKNYDTYCAACHQADGKGIPPIYPALRADSVAVGGTIARHIDIVMHGVPGTAMQAFDKQLSDTQIASIVTYERNAWGNRTGDVVQPATVAKQRQKVEEKFDAKEEKKLKENIKEIKKTNVIVPQNDKAKK